MQPGFVPPARARSARLALRIVAPALRITCSRRSGQLAGDPPHHGLGLVALLLTAQPQLEDDRASTPTRRAASIAGAGTRRAPNGFDPQHRATDGANGLGQQTRIGRIAHIGLYRRGVRTDLVGTQ